VALQQHGYDGLYDRRKGKPSPKRVPLETVEKVLQLYRQEYADHNVRSARKHDLGWFKGHAISDPSIAPEPANPAARLTQPDCGNLSLR
jgi:hypothetical protein